MWKNLFKSLLPAFIFFGGFFISANVHAEVVSQKFYSTYDGRLLSADLTSWQEARDTVQATWMFDKEDFQNAPATGYMDYADQYRNARRYDVFDTTNIPVNAVIKSAKFYFYIVNIYNDDDSGIVLVKTTQNSTSTLDMNVYSEFENISGGIKNFSEMKIGEYNNLELNAEALAWIKKGEWTKLGLITTHDYFNINPIKGNSLIAAFSESPGTDKDPYLEITYEVPDSNTLRIYANEGNARLRASYKTTYDEARNASQADALVFGETDDQYIYFGQGVEVSTNMYHVSRFSLPFDTSIIPEKAKITSAKIFVKGYQHGVGYSHGGDSEVVLVEMEQMEQPDSVSVLDYNKFKGFNLGVNTIPVKNWNEENFFTLNNFGIDNINNNGTSFFGLRMKTDIDNQIPTNWTDWVFSHTSHADGTDKDPYLEITYEFPDEGVKNPVVVVPGILASYLNKNVAYDYPEIWPNLFDMVLSPTDAYLDYLKMDFAGDSVNKDIISRDLIRSIANKDLYDGLIEELKNSGYDEGVNLFVFPYDWRYDLDVTAGVRPVEGVSNLRDRIEDVLERTGGEKVDIIAHSMGGLLTKNYLNYFGSSTVGKFIDIATPHLGAPKAFKMLQYGDSMGFSAVGMGLDLNRAKEITQNMPAVYQLLPSSNYFSFYDSGYFFVKPKNGSINLYDFNSSLVYLAEKGAYGNIINTNEILHDKIDDYSYDNAYNIVGCNMATIGKIGVFEEKNKKRYSLRYVDGDGTVPLESARNFKEPIAYSYGAVHSFIPGQEGIKQFVGSILDGTEGEFNFNDFWGMTYDANECGIDGNQVSVHSPIDLHVYDSENNHSGPNENFGYDDEIFGSQYDRFDDDKFVFLPTGGDYVVHGSSTGVGVFSLRVNRVVESEYVGELYYHEIAIGPNSKFYFNITNGVADEFIHFDFDGDGVYEKVIYPSAVLVGDEVDDVTAPISLAKLNGAEVNNSMFSDDVDVEFQSSDNDGGAGVLMTMYSFDGENWLEYSDLLNFDDVGEYEIQFYSIDRMGNVEDVKEVNFSIKKYGGIDDLIEYISQSYDDGLINKKLVKHNLIQKLENLKKTLERQEGIEEFVDSKLEKINSKNKFNNNVFKGLKYVEDKIVNLQLDKILKDLVNYFDKGWIEEVAKDYIIEFVEYLRVEL